MTIYYQQSRISSIAFAKTEQDLNGISTDPSSIFKFDSEIDESKLNNLKLEIENLNSEIETIKSKSNDSSQNSEAISNIQEQISDKISKMRSIKLEIYSQADEIFSHKIKELENLNENVKTIIINAESPMFHDIEFSIPQDKVEINSESLRQDPLSGISLGNSVMLDSLMDQHFVILPGRKSSNIKSNLNQNHECIDALAANGLMNSPKIMSEYSVGKLIDAISKNQNLNSLNIYIIHSALKVKLLNYNGISTINIPCYAVGKGEILSVFFRYLALTFFPYLAVYDATENVDYKYDI